MRNQPDTSIVCSTTVLLLNECLTGPREDDAVVSYHRTRRSRSALAYGEHSTAAATTTSPDSYTTSGDATRRKKENGMNIREASSNIASDPIVPWGGEAGGANHGVGRDRVPRPSLQPHVRAPITRRDRVIQTWIDWRDLFVQGIIIALALLVIPTLYLLDSWYYWLFGLAALMAWLDHHEWFID